MQTLLLPGVGSPGGWKVFAYRSRDWNAWNPVWYFHHKHFHCITHWAEGNLAIKDKLIKKYKRDLTNFFFMSFLREVSVFQNPRMHVCN